MSYKNRGMFLESIINKTISIYKKNEIALFEKISVNIKFRSIKKHNNKINVSGGYIKEKSSVDYIGIYKGIFIAFETKSTEKDYLSFNNIKIHQDNYLNQIIKYGGIAFYIICFKEYNEFYIVDPKEINKKDNKKIKRQYCIKNCYALILEYPGILDLINYLNQRI